MTVRVNEFQQPIGDALPKWQAASLPSDQTLVGRYCRLERIDVERHAADLYDAYQDASDGRDWTYLFAGPFDTFEAYRGYLAAAATLIDPMHYAVIDLTSGKAVGTLALMRIDAPNGVIEVGSITYSPRMKRTRISTEAMALLMKYVFEELGYRRFEWKCDSLNAPSRTAALRYGFKFEGIFRQAVVTRQRNRDTAWFSIIDSEYPTLLAAYERWLAPDNFDAHGMQQRSLVAIRTDVAHAAVDRRRDVGHATLTVRPLVATDEPAWHTLWRDYQAFYNTALSENVFAKTWARLLDKDEPMFVLGAFDEAGQLLGIVHAIYHLSCWTTGPYCYLQDLYTATDARGLGVGRALINAVYAHARDAGASRVYWLTHETNATARTLYDQVATNAGFIQYRKDIS